MSEEEIEVYQKSERDIELEEFGTILSTYSGRKFIWRLLARCNIFDSVPVENALKLAAATAITNYGKWLMVEIQEVGPEYWTQMQKEALERVEKAQKEVDVRRTEYDRGNPGEFDSID